MFGKSCSVLNETLGAKSAVGLHLLTQSSAGQTAVTAVISEELPLDWLTVSGSDE